MKSKLFQEKIWEQGRRLFRPMPWRDHTDPYWILVSELMLQQTQVDRVIPKFEAFIDRFPDVQTLAAAPLGGVLELWSGLGYNRRARFLHEAAKKIVSEFGGTIPSSPMQLQTLPGVGVNTAGAIATYGFNKVAPFVETNVRTVYFHEYFEDTEGTITDTQLLQAVEATIDTEHPREWYWALMDYGSWLKRNGFGATQRSAHYVKQFPLKGSLREVRGMILKLLTAQQRIDRVELLRQLPQDSRAETALAALIREGMVVDVGSHLSLPS